MWLLLLLLLLITVTGATTNSSRSRANRPHGAWCGSEHGDAAASTRVLEFALGAGDVLGQSVAAPCRWRLARGGRCAGAPAVMPINDETVAVKQKACPLVQA